MLTANGANGSQLKRLVVRLLSGPQRLRLTLTDSLTLTLVAIVVVGTTAGMCRRVHAAPACDVAEATKAASQTPNDGDVKENKTEQPPDTSTASPALPNDGTKSIAADPNQIEFSGTVVDFDDKPVAGAEIWFALPPETIADPAAKPTVRQLTQCDGQGKFSFRLNQIQATGGLALNWLYLSRVTAKAPGYGSDWLPPVVFEDHPVSSPKRDDAEQKIDSRLGKGRFASRTLKLPPDAGPVKGRLIDLEGRPLADVAVFVERVGNTDFSILTELFEKPSDLLLSKAFNVRSVSVGSSPHDWQVLMPIVKTNQNGEFSLSGLGRDQVATVTLQGEHIASERLFIVGHEMETKSLPYQSRFPNGPKHVYVGTHFTHAVGSGIPVEGIVTEFQSSKPIANATVFVDRLFGGRRGSSTGEIRLDTWHMYTVTDQQGRYRILGVPPGDEHVLSVITPNTEPWLVGAQEFSLSSDEVNPSVNIQVFKGIWLEGRVTDAKTGEPIAGHVAYRALGTNTNTPQNSGLREGTRLTRFPIDELGRYRVAGLPGPGVLLVRSNGEKVYPLGIGADNIERYDPNRRSLKTVPIGTMLSDWNLALPIDPPIETTSYTQDLTLSAGASLVGQVLKPDGEPASRLQAMGQDEKDVLPRTITGNRFTITNYEPNLPRTVFFKTEDNSLAGYLRVEGEQSSELTVTLQPAVTVKGRLVETESGDNAVGYRMYCESSKLGNYRGHEPTTDENGLFEIKGLLAGNTYKMTAYSAQGRPINRQDGFTIDLSKAKPGDVLELGDVTGKNAKSGIK